MTDVITSTTPHARHRSPVLVTLAAGLFGGAALGVAARAWMRLISDDPEFSWAGTLFIIGGFTMFGTLQSIVAAARGRVRRRWLLVVIRVIGIAAMMPLFVAAGAIMFPTVIGAGLARARTDWPRWSRLVCVVVSIGPLGLVASKLVGDFGWSLQSAAGFLIMVLIYGVIIWATRSAFEPQKDGWRLPRRVRTVLLVLVPVVFLLSIVGAGGLQ